jgi:hypothetical protein
MKVIQQDGRGGNLRDYHIGQLLNHLNCVPDAGEAFNLLDTVRQLGGVTAEEAAMILHLYWEDK